MPLATNANINASVAGPATDYLPLVSGTHNESSLPIDLATATPKLGVVLRGLENITGSDVTVSIQGPYSNVVVALTIPARTIRPGYVAAITGVTSSQIVGHI